MGVFCLLWSWDTLHHIDSTLKEKHARPSGLKLYCSRTMTPRPRSPDCHLTLTPLSILCRHLKEDYKSKLFLCNNIKVCFQLFQLFTYGLLLQQALLLFTPFYIALYCPYRLSMFYLCLKLFLIGSGSAI